MTYYMADILLPTERDEDFIKLIPKQQAVIKEMMSRGAIHSYSLSEDKTRLWVVVAAKDDVDARNIIGCFPIFNHIKVKIQALLFNQTSVFNSSQLWMN